MHRKIFLLSLILLFVPFISRASVVNRASVGGVSSGLIGWWTFDGKDITSGVSRDLSGNANHANHFNIASSTFYKEGKIGQGFSFDGVNDYLGILGDSATLRPTSITISAWINYTGTIPTDTAKTIVSLHQNDFIFRIKDSADASLQAVVYDGSTNAIDGGAGTALTRNIWTHVVLVYTGSAVLFWKDGVFISSATAPAITWEAPAGVPSIGALQSGSGNFFAGRIDDVRIYNTSLATSSIKMIYNQGAGGKIGVSPANPLTSGLAGWWTFDGKDMPNGRATDLSGNGRTGYAWTGFSTSTVYTEGKIGQALKFGKANTFIQIPTAASLTVPYAISMWFNQNDATGNQSLLGFGLSDPLHILHLSGGSLYLISASAGTFRTFCNTTFTTNRWYHLVFIVNSSSDASQWKCYVNGEDAGVSGSDSSGTYGNPGSTDWTIGAYYNNSYWFQGKIDDVRIYSKSLSATDVKKIYTLGGQGKQNVSPANFLTSGLVGHWTFDGKDITSGVSRDLSGNNNHAYFINISTSTFYTIGKLGQAGRFASTLSNIGTVPAAASINDLAALTVSVWVKPEVLNLGTFISKGDNSSGGHGWSLGTDALNGRIKFSVMGYTGTDLSAPTVNNALTAGTWNHVVATWDGGSATSGVHIYVNGVEVALLGPSAGGTGPQTDAGSPIQIGANTGGGGNGYFSGQIDEVRVYNRVLSARDVSTLYNLAK
jgi:hypothetical protein